MANISVDCSSCVLDSKKRINSAIIPRCCCDSGGVPNLEALDNIYNPLYLESAAKALMLSSIWLLSATGRTRNQVSIIRSDVFSFTGIAGFRAL